MKKIIILILFLNIISSCSTKNKDYTMEFLTEEIPYDIPIDFMEDLIPDTKIIHKGSFSPDLSKYYFTLSDKNFENFNVYVTHKENGYWSKPKEAFFSSNYDEHGMSFSPDGNTIYFSSTRPVHIEGIGQTWHIWKSDKISGEWTKPVFVDIPNLEDKLVSHPVITNSGTLYFHASNLDYSDMDIYRSKKVNGKFAKAEQISLSLPMNNGKCTPYVSPNEDFLIFAAIDDKLDLFVSFIDEHGNWTKTRRLNNKINNLGQGNPYVTSDNKYLFYTTGEYEEKKWKVKWVNIESELNRK